jgi:hypothetical protein
VPSTKTRTVLKRSSPPGSSHANGVRALPFRRYPDLLQGTAAVGFAAEGRVRTDPLAARTRRDAADKRKTRETTFVILLISLGRFYSRARDPARCRRLCADPVRPVEWRPALQH